LGGEGVQGVALLAARSALRSRLVPGAACLLVGVLVALAWSGMGDESPAGRLRAFLSLSASFVSFVLALCAIFLPPRLAADLTAGRLTQVVTGPLSRAQLLLAWWLGTSAVLIVLTILGYAAIGLGAEAVLRWGHDEERVSADVLRGYVLTAQTIARAEVPSEDEFQEAAEARYQALAAQNRLTAEHDPDLILSQIRAALELETRSLGPGQTKTWRINDLDLSGESLVLNFKFDATWPKFVPMNQRLVPLQIVVGVDKDQLWVPDPKLYKTGQSYDMAVPIEQVRGHETLEVSFRNGSANQGTMVFPRRGPTFRYPAGGFVRNLARAAWVEISRLLFLVAVGVIMSALFDGKLATLAVLWVVALSYGQGFLSESLRPGLFGAADAGILPVLRGVLWAIPDLGRAEIGAALAGGEAIRANWLLGSSQDVFLRTPILLGLGAFFFTRRELGAVQ
jgi:hypothetical protein